MSEQEHTLLIVDDNESNRDLLARRLEHKGFVVATASDGRQALDILENRRFDMILLDLMMPGISGLEVLQRVRQRFDAAELPIIMVTAHNDNSAIIGCLELGANDYVTKPVDIPVLLARIHAQLDRKRAEAALKDANRGLEHEVEQRTAELRSANDALKIEVADRGNAEERVRLLLESTAEAIFGVDLEGNCIFCNPAGARLLGYDDPSELAGKNLPRQALRAKADGSALGELQHPIGQAIAAGEQIHSDEDVFWRADETSFPAEYWVHPMRHDGQLVGAVVTFVDISERVSFNQRLNEAQKLEAVGALAGGIAHEFNNLLMIIGGYIKKAVRNRENPEEFESDLEKAETATNRAANLTKQLLVFSRKQTVEQRVVDLADHLKEIERLLHPLLGERFEIDLDIGDETVLAELDPEQLSQCVINLVINARDAMPEGGRVTLGAKVSELGAESLVALGLDASPGRYAAIFVKDRGTGMDEETKRRIFEPFFTTKAPGSGTGLGLAMVYGFVQTSQGFLTVDSEVGVGSTFTLFFSLADAKPPAIDKPGADMAEGRGEVILLVEDEAPLRELLSDTLQNLGYSVLAAQDGPDALEIEEDYDGAIDLLLSDVVMPSFGGVEVIRALRQTRPEIKAILMSGYPMHGEARNIALPEDIPFLSKPVDPDLLARTIREQLDDGPGRVVAAATAGENDLRIAK